MDESEEKIKNKNQNEFSKNKDDEYESLQANKKSKHKLKAVVNKYKKVIMIMSIAIFFLLICIIIILFKNPSTDNSDEVVLKEEKGNKNESVNNNETENNQITNQLTSNINNDIDFKEYNDKFPDGSFDFSKLNYPVPSVKRKIYVKYMDFWPAFVLERFDVHKILIERYEVVVSDNPDYVIFSEFGGENYGMENKYNCVKLFLSIENRGPNFENTDYAIGIHYINKGDRYFRKPTEVHQLTAIHSVYNVTKVKEIDIKKKKFCAWVVSNGGGYVRNKFFDKLSEYKKVDSGGSFRNNIGGAVSDKLGFLKNYKFSICFENSKTQGYISEKLSDAFEAGTIPIYYGDDTVLEILNNRSYIHVKDEDDFAEKIELIKKIDQNDTLYEEMIREKIVIDDNRYPREVQKYKNFIYHVIEQDKEKAKRFERKIKKSS